MNKYLQIVIQRIRNAQEQFMRLSRQRRILIGATLFVVFGFIITMLAGGNTEAEVTVNKIQEVTTSSIADFANGDDSLPLLGIVTSTNEAVIRAESSGKLNRVYKKLGDFVVAGQVIAEFENASERASLLQAEGAYDQAKAGRDIARINSGTTDTSLTDAQTGAINTISSVYISMDESIRVKTDGVYSNPRTTEARMLLTVPDSALVITLETKRKAIEKQLLARDARNRTLSESSDLLGELDQVQTEALGVKTYLDDLSQAYAKAIPDNVYTQAMIDSGKASVGSARTLMSGAISSLLGSKTSLTNSLAAQKIAGRTSGDTTTGVATADASVKQALGAYNGALSRLEKTVIRSPITGTLNSLSIKTGDFISAFTEIGVVSNNGALEVVTYVTEDDASRVIVGSSVTIDGGIKGIITRAASAIDPKTKKIEVRIGITEGKSSLINGQSVRVEVAQPSRKVTSTKRVNMIPLSALKITPKGTLVFTVDASSTLVAIPVTVGALMGDRIQLLTGVTENIQIVKDVRGLKEGMSVVVRGQDDR